MTNTAILNTSNKNSIKYARENDLKIKQREREREREIYSVFKAFRSALIDKGIVNTG